MIRLGQSVCPETLQSAPIFQNVGPMSPDGPVYLDAAARTIMSIGALYGISNLIRCSHLMPSGRILASRLCAKFLAAFASN